MKTRVFNGDVHKDDDDGEVVLKKYLKRCRKTHGDRGERTLDVIMTYGVFLKLLGRVGEAEPLYREALVGRKRILGKDHPETLGSINNLAALLYEQGKYDQAEPLYREAVAGYKRALGDEHPNTKRAVKNLSNLLSKQGRTL